MTIIKKDHAFYYNKSKDQLPVLHIYPAYQMTKHVFQSILPTYGTQGSACFDFRLPHGFQYTKCDRDIYLIGTGLKFSFLANYALFVLSRSSLAMKGCVVINSPGIIDSDYTGEVKILMRIPTKHKKEVLKKGVSIAQGMFIKTHRVDFGNKSTVARGEGGFGSTD